MCHFYLRWYDERSRDYQSCCCCWCCCDIFLTFSFFGRFFKAKKAEILIFRALQCQYLNLSLLYLAEFVACPSRVILCRDIGSWSSLGTVSSGRSRIRLLPICLLYIRRLALQLTNICVIRLYKDNWLSWLIYMFNLYFVKNYSSLSSRKCAFKYFF